MRFWTVRIHGEAHDFTSSWAACRFIEGEVGMHSKHIRITLTSHYRKGN